MSEGVRSRFDLNGRLARLALYRWWRRTIVARVDHEAVIARIVEESGWSPRFAFMTMMSAGIAVLRSQGIGAVAIPADGPRFPFCAGIGAGAGETDR